MTPPPPGEPSPRALGESLAALVAQLADLRGQVRATNAQLDQAGLRPGLNLAVRFDELAETVIGHVSCDQQGKDLSGVSLSRRLAVGGTIVVLRSNHSGDHVQRVPDIADGQVMPSGEVAD